MLQGRPREEERSRASGLFTRSWAEPCSLGTFLARFCSAPYAPPHGLSPWGLPDHCHRRVATTLAARVF